MSKKIVIVGGGSGGLELAARLCKKFKKNKSVEIILIDKQLKHVWKPLLHQVAAGTSSSYDEIDYISYAYEKGFIFFFGTVKSLDRENKIITLEERKIYYDILVIAIGSQANDFNILGVKDHCLLLDDLYEAEYFNKLLVKNIVKITQENTIEQIDISIVGGGATGIELAAELNHVLEEARKYSRKMNNQVLFQITVIESANQVLNMMPKRISNVVTRYLLKHNIKVLTNTRIVAVNSQGLTTEDGTFIKSSMIVWAAGVKSNFLPVIHELELNNINQLLVNEKLQVTKDENIFAFGDCACCPQRNRSGKISYVPPRAQAAYQQARMLTKSIANLLQQKPLPSYRYKDYGSLIALTNYNVVGNLMSNVAKNFYIEGTFARLTYWMLYKRHLIVLKGFKYVLFRTIADFIMKKQQPEIKLH